MMWKQERTITKLGRETKLVKNLDDRETDVVEDKNVKNRDIDNNLKR